MVVVEYNKDAKCGNILENNLVKRLPIKLNPYIPSDALSTLPSTLYCGNILHIPQYSTTPPVIKKT
ncbi:MAG: hypothetical protein H6Q14_1030 [Bacteroidetes bacterium]|nr:hypothetical protein [Bacteroidota bacterium]